MSDIIQLSASGPVVTGDDWILVRGADDGSLPEPAALPAGKLLVPFAYWQTHRAALEALRTPAQLGVWLAPEQEPADVAEHFAAFSLIAIDFPVFRDGRGYSIARLLRSRYGWSGPLRAIGDVLRDQLYFLSRCGFDAFAVRADKDIHDALKAFSEFTVSYQAAQDEPRPLFRRRAANGAETAA